MHRGTATLFELANPAGDTLARRTGPEPYQSLDVHSFRTIPQVQEHLTERQRFAIDVVARILPFRTNRYVIDELIDWAHVPDDPIYRMTFPQREMLDPGHFHEIANLIQRGAPEQLVESCASAIRHALNPDTGEPANGYPGVPGLQHIAPDTALYFPTGGQACHAYCTFCFRWSQLDGAGASAMDTMETSTPSAAVDYLRRHREITSLVVTGGDPLTMSTAALRGALEPLLTADLPELGGIRIATKALSYWPHRFVTDADADGLLELFRDVMRRGKQLELIAHFNHPAELRTEIMTRAVHRLREAGVTIRTQAPLLRHINDHASEWADMWRVQAQLGMIPDAMYVLRDTASQEYFSVPLVEAWALFRDASAQTEGAAAAVAGPVMVTDAGRVLVAGVTERDGQRVIALRMVQGRRPEWTDRVFHARYDPDATWLDELEPAFGEERFFFEEPAEPVQPETLAVAAD